MACMNWHIKCVLLEACYGFKIWCIAVPPTPAQPKKLTLPVAVRSITSNKISLTYGLKYYLLKIIKFTYPYHNLVTISPTTLFTFLLVTPFIAELMRGRVGTGHQWKRDESGHSSFGHAAALRLQEPPKAEKLRLRSLRGIWCWPFWVARWRVPGAQLSPLMCLICWSHL